MFNVNIDNSAFRSILRLAKINVENKPIKYNAAAGLFETAPLGWILHVTDGNGSPYEMFNNAPVGSRKFSHLYVGKDGHVEQFGDLRYKSWAQVDGNSTYWSVETEGLPTEALTQEQLHSLAVIHIALSIMRQSDISHIANAPGQVGIGTHQMGGAAWGGHACPGTIRADQRDVILALANKLRIV